MKIVKPNWFIKLVAELIVALSFDFTLELIQSIWIGHLKPQKKDSMVIIIALTKAKGIKLGTKKRMPIDIWEEINKDLYEKLWDIFSDYNEPRKLNAKESV